MSTPLNDDLLAAPELSEAQDINGIPGRSTKVLKELLAHSVQLRNLYKLARCQTSDSQSLLLRPLFDEHYQEQVRMVDVLVERIRAQRGEAQLIGGALGQTVFAGRILLSRLFQELLESHDEVLNTIHGNEYEDEDEDSIIGQLALTNQLQCDSLRERFIRIINVKGHKQAPTRLELVDVSDHPDIARSP